MWRATAACGLAAALVLVAAVAARAEPLALEVASARARYDQRFGLNVVDVTLSPGSKDAFATFTAAHVGDQVALRSDGSLLMSVVVREPIAAGVLQISGSFTVDEAAQIAVRLSRPGARIDVEALPK
jgi:preprotein translocase subunit SecD